MKETPPRLLGRDTALAFSTLNLAASGFERKAKEFFLPFFPLQCKPHRPRDKWSLL